MTVKIVFDRESRKLLKGMGYSGVIKSVEAKIRTNEVYDFLQELNPNFYISEDRGSLRNYAGVYKVGARGIRVYELHDQSVHTVQLKKGNSGRREDAEMLASNVFEASEDGLVPDMDIVRQQINNVFHSRDSETSRYPVLDEQSRIGIDERR